MRTRFPHTKADGSVLVEMAMVLPLLLLFIFGIVDGARLVATQNDVRTAAREAARYGSAVGFTDSGIPQFVDCDGIRAAGTHLNSIVDLAPADITVQYDSGPGTAIKANCPESGPGPDASLIAHGDRVVVTISVPFNPATPLLDRFFGGISVSTADRRTVFAP